MNDKRPLSERTALITGAGRGIGAAAARALAAMGATIIATYRNDHTAAKDLSARLHSEHDVPVHLLRYDLTAPPSDPAGADELLTAVAQISDGVDVLVANAASPYPKVPLLELPAQQLVTKVAQDVGAMHRLVTALAPGMLERAYGRMILIGSLHALGPTAPGMAASGVSKAALAAYADYVVDELTGPGVTVNTIHPGYIATDASSHLPPEIPRLLQALTPAGRTGVPDDIGGVVAMLARDEAGFLNGASIPVTGGMSHPVPLRRLHGTRSPGFTIEPHSKDHDARLHIRR